jgi:hypothetical protein
MSGETETLRVQRLQRHLRALSAVNRQLQAQLEGGTVGIDPTIDEDLRDAGPGVARWTSVKPRRTGPGSDWLDALRRLEHTGVPFVVHAPDQGVFVVEGAVRRRVMSGLLGAALTRSLGPARAISNRDLERLPEGPPVAVLEAPVGRPFVVVGGKRRPLRGLPLPHPVTNEEMLSFPPGEELLIGAGMQAGAGRVARARALVGEQGAGRATAELARRAARRLRRALPGAD